MTANENLTPKLKELQEKWAKIKALCPEWALVVEGLDDYRYRRDIKVTPKTNWTIKVGDADAVTDCLLELAEKLEQAEKEIKNILSDDDIVMPPNKEYEIRLKFDVQKNDGPYVDKEES